LVARRVPAGILTLLVVSLLIFLATNALPGNVAQVILGKNATPQRLALYEQSLGLNRPLMVQYFSWLGGMLHGNFGQSAVQLASGAKSAPISAMIGTPLLNSLILAGISTIVLLPLALGLGVLAGVRAHTAVDGTISYVALVVGALPEFVLGTFVILVFFTEFNWFPPVALVPQGSSPLAHPNLLVLPVMTLVGVSLAFCVRQVRSGVLSALSQTYVAAARLNGLPERRVIWRHAVRNALAPSVQAFAQTIVYLFGGIVIVESLFDYPGIGSQLIQAVQSRDVTVVEAIALILAAFSITITIAADLIVVLLVPKLKTSR
jgi:peptide/nickel transport system permease protein